MKFSILGESLEWSSGAMTYFSIRKQFVDLANAQSDHYTENFSKKYRNLESLVKEGFDDGIKYILPAIQLSVQTLVEHGVYSVSEEALSQNFFAKSDLFETAFEKIADEYHKIILNGQQLDEYRTQRRQNRGRWIGGGFGTKGAVNGAINAAMLNMAFGAAHMVWNGIGKLFTDAANDKKMSEVLKKEVKAGSLSQAICSSVYQLHFLVVELINENDPSKKIPVFLSEERFNKASAIYENIKKYPPQNTETLKNKYLEIIELCPYVKDLFKSILENFGDKSNDLESFGKYIGVDLRSHKLALLKIDSKAIGSSIENFLAINFDNLLAKASHFGYDEKKVFNEILAEVSPENMQKIFFKLVADNNLDSALFKSVEKCFVQMLYNDMFGLEKLSDFLEQAEKFKSLFPKYYDQILERILETINKNDFSIEKLLEFNHSLETFKKPEIFAALCKRIIYKSGENNLSIEQLNLSINFLEINAHDQIDLLKNLKNRLNAKIEEKRQWDEWVAEVKVIISSNYNSVQDSIFLAPDIPEKKLTGVFSYVNKTQRSGEEILLIYDSTVFGSADTGLAFTPNALIWKNGSGFSNYAGKLGHLSWKEIKKVVPNSDGEIIVDDQYILLSIPEKRRQSLRYLCKCIELISSAAKESAEDRKKRKQIEKEKQEFETANLVKELTQNEFVKELTQNKDFVDALKGIQGFLNESGVSTPAVLEGMIDNVQNAEVKTSKDKKKKNKNKLSEKINEEMQAEKTCLEEDASIAQKNISETEKKSQEEEMTKRAAEDKEKRDGDIKLAARYFHGIENRTKTKIIGFLAFSVVAIIAREQLLVMFLALLGVLVGYSTLTEEEDKGREAYDRLKKTEFEEITKHENKFTKFSFGESLLIAIIPGLNLLLIWELIIDCRYSYFQRFMMFCIVAFELIFFL